MNLHRFEFLYKIILSYIKSNNAVDYFILSKYINTSKSLIANLVQELINNNYISCSGGQIFITEKGMQIKIIEWDTLKEKLILQYDNFTYKDFIWDEVYVPIDFKIE